MMNFELEDKIFDKMQQYKNALRLHCYHVARARLRDVADLQHERNPEHSREVYFQKLIADHPEVNGKSAPIKGLF